MSQVHLDTFKDMRSLVLGTLTALTLGLVATSTPAVAHQPAPTAHAKAKVPALVVKKLVTGLDHPWDVRPIGGEIGRASCRERV